MKNITFSKLVDKNKSTPKLICDLLYSAIMIVLIATIVFSLASRVLNGGSKVSNIMGYTPTIVVSGSMVPTIEINSLCIMKNVDISKVELGDIIVYRNPENGRNIIHRVIGIADGENGRYLTMKGDANYREDRYRVDSNMFIGKIICICNWAVPYISNCVKDESIDYVTLSSYITKGLILAFIVIYVLYIIIYLIINYIVRKMIEMHRRKRDGIQVKGDK